MEIRAYSYLYTSDIDKLIERGLNLAVFRQIELRNDSMECLKPYNEIEEHRIFRISPDNSSTNFKNAGTYFKRNGNLFRMDGETETEIPKEIVPDKLTIAYDYEMGCSEEVEELIKYIKKPINDGSAYCRHEFVGGTCVFCGGTKYKRD